MAELTVEINTKNLEKALRLFPKELKYEIADGMDHISRRFLKNFWQARLQGPPGIKAHGHGFFSHFYRASLVASDIEGMGMVIFSDSKIAKLHEEGGRVSSPGGRKLAVPLSARTEMFKADGALKMQYKHPSMIKNVIPIVLRGKTYLAKVKQRAKEILPLFVLKNSVKIKPRLGFYATWDSMQADRINILNKSIKKVLEKTTI